MVYPALLPLMRTPRLSAVDLNGLVHFAERRNLVSARVPLHLHWPVLWTSDQPVAQTCTRQHTTLTTDKHPWPPVGFEPTISAGERPQTYALDRAATGTGFCDVSVW